MQLDARRARKTLTMSTRDGDDGERRRDGRRGRRRHAIRTCARIVRRARALASSRRAAAVAPTPRRRRSGKNHPARASRQPRRRARSARRPPDASTTPRVNPRAGDARESVDRRVSRGGRHPRGSPTRRRARRRLPSRRKTASTVALARDDAVIPSRLRPGAVWAGSRAARELAMVATMRTLRNFTMFPSRVVLVQRARE